MTGADTNGHSVQVVESVPQEASVADVTRSTNGCAPFVPEKQGAKSLPKINGHLIVVGVGIVLPLALLAFKGLPRHSKLARQPLARQPQQQSQQESPEPASSVTPILETGHTTTKDANGSFVNPEQIGRTAIKPAKPSPATTLADLKPFDGSQWQPAPYQPGLLPAASTDAAAGTPEVASVRSDRDALDKASLVFVKNSSTPPSQKARDHAPEPEMGLGMAPGARLRARLESAVNTAVRTPVVAVIEYNYEQNGEIIIPAGTKAFGRLESADRSGYIGIRFESLLMPDGTSLPLEALATDLQLRPLRGNVEGKHTGKNLLVRSFAGVGEIAATLVGRGSLNQPLSEGDLMRATVANNIGQASDQTVANLAITEHIVVSLPAETEIYVILQKPAKEGSQSPQPPMPSGSPSQVSVEQLRQPMQLQRELNESPSTSGSQE